VLLLDEMLVSHRSVLLNGLDFGVEFEGFLSVDAEADVEADAEGVAEDEEEAAFTGVLGNLVPRVALVDAAARFIAASAAFLRAETLSEIVGATAGEDDRMGVVEDEGVDEDDAGAFLHLWFVGQRCSAQNCWLHSLQRIGATSTLLHFARAHRGSPVEVGALVFKPTRPPPRTTSHLRSKCSSMAIFGSTPAPKATGLWQNGHSGAIRSCLLGSNLAHE